MAKLYSQITLALERQGLALYQDQLSHGLAQQAERMSQVEKLVKMKDQMRILSSLKSWNRSERKDNFSNNDLST